jgi:hypothetical protein
VDKENVILWLKKTPLWITTDLYLFARTKSGSVNQSLLSSLPFFPKNSLINHHWNCINYEFSEDGDFTWAKIYIDNFSYSFHADGGLVPEAYFSEFSIHNPLINAPYIEKNDPYLLVGWESSKEMTLGLKIRKKRNALYWNNVSYTACMNFLQRWFWEDFLVYAELKKYESHLSETKNYHVCYDLFQENWKNIFVNFWIFLQI